MSKEMRKYIDDFISFNLKESNDNEYINHLLDKINKKGIDSLSDSEKNRLNQLSSDNIEDRTLRVIDGEMYIGDVSYDRFLSTDYQKHIYPKSDEVSDANRMFFSKIKNMNISSIEIDGNVLPVEIIEEMSGEHLKIGDYILSPFYEGQKGISVNYGNNNYLYELNNVPQTISEIDEFVVKFFKTYVKQIVE
jgi:hypothetical protein